MSTSERLERACNGYIHNAQLVGVLYVVVPALLWYLWVAAVAPFRWVYPLRLVLSLAAGAPIGGFLNRSGLWLWIVKHRSPCGPATLTDGALIGGAVGFGCALLPALTSLIATNHPEAAKAFVIVAWAGAALLGAVIGIALAAIGRDRIEREWPEGAGGAECGSS